MTKHDRMLEKLASRRRQFVSMGGLEKIDRQHEQGKLTARERVDLLLDPGSFQEYGLLATHDGAAAETDITPSDGLVAGIGRIQSRPVCLFAEDFTVKAGSVGHNGFWKRLRMQEIATQERIPFIGLFDGAGARATDMLSSAEGSPVVKQHFAWARQSGRAPLIGAVMGPCAGLSALEAAQMEICLMVGPTGMLAAGGPPVVKASIGVDIEKSDLGGPDVHEKTTGMVDLVTETDMAAILKIRQILSYLPTNSWSFPPVSDAVTEPVGSILEILPENAKTPYDMKEIISCLFDRDSFLELKPNFGKAMVVGLALLNGHPVGVLSNQPAVRAGAIDAAEAQKARKFIDLCGAYHLPIISLTDTPGVMTGPEAERRGTLKQGLAAAHSLAMANIPVFSVILRKSFGFGGALMAGYLGEQTVTLAWPSAEFSSLPPDAAIKSAHAGELEASDEPEELLKTLQAAYTQMASPYPAAGDFKLDDVIDPRETRARLIQSLELSLARRSQGASPTPKFGVMP